MRAMPRRFNQDALLDELDPQQPQAPPPMPGTPAPQTGGRAIPHLQTYGGPPLSPSAGGAPSAGALETFKNNLAQMTGAMGPQQGTALQQDPAPAPAGGYDRTRVRDTFMSSTAKNRADLEALIAANPDFMTGVTIGGSGDIAYMPNGEAYDVIGNMGSGGQERGTWTPVPGRGEWASMPGQGGGGGAAPGMPQSAMGGLAMAQAQGAPVDPLLGGDPMAKIQAAIGQYANQRPNLEALLAQLG
jgi:hypothetical protein